MTSVCKDTSQIRQKKMIADHYHRLAVAPETGDKSAYTFVPGNVTELLLSFDLLPVLPEINALQSGMRGKSREYIALAEKAGHSEDVCTYVKSDIGMLKSGNIGPTGERLAARYRRVLDDVDETQALERGVGPDALPLRNQAQAAVRLFLRTATHVSDGVHCFVPLCGRLGPRGVPSKRVR